MSTVYAKVAVASFWAGVFFSFMHVVYGYFFNVWSEFASLLRPNANVFMTKFGETMLFGFLGPTLLLLSIAASRLARSESRER